MPFSISFSGGLDVQSIVSQLIQAERAPQRTLEQARIQLTAKSKALDAFEQRLESIRTAAETVRKPGALDQRSATSSDDSSVTATVAAGTQTGSYDVVVTTLASTQSYASSGFASADAALPEGSFDLTTGGTTTTIAVDGSATLESLRDAINASGAGVQALVLYDGSSYRLSLTSKTSGAAGAITIDSWSSAELQSALGLSEKSPARDAAFSVNGLSMTRGSNHVTDAVDGLVLDLRKAGGEAVVTVAADLEQSVQAIRKFVDSYNSLNAHIREQLAAGDRSAGPLGELSSVRRLQDQLKSLFSRSVTGLDGDVVNLRQVGLELQNDGSIVVDDAKLRSGLENGTARNLFSQSGRTTDTRVRFAHGSKDTQAGTYGITVTRAAERAEVTGALVIGGGGLAQDEKLTFTRGSTTVDVQLTTGMSLATVASTINQALGGTGIGAFAADDGSGKLRIRSQGYGSGANVDVHSDTDANGSTGIFSAGLNDAGVDVAGSIAGTAATGIGRTLTALGGNAKGLAVEVTASAAEIDPGGTGLGDAVVSIGVGEATYRTLDRELGTTSGSLVAERSGIRARDKLLLDRIDAMDRRLNQRQSLLTRQLQRADEALQRMSALSQTLSAQLGR